MKFNIGCIKYWASIMAFVTVLGIVAIAVTSGITWWAMTLFK